MTLSKATLVNGNVVRISTLFLLSFLLGAIIWFADRQTTVDARQDTQIDQRVRIERYLTDKAELKDYVKERFDGLEKKIDKVLK